MSRDPSSPLSRLNAAIASSSATAAITAAFRRLTGGAPQPAPPSRQLAAGDSGADLARERARRSLLEARQAMSGMIVDVPPAPKAPAIEPAGGITPDLEQLRSYLETGDRERAQMRDEIASLREAVEALRTRVDALERAPAPSPGAVGPEGTGETEPLIETAEAISESPAEPAEQPVTERPPAAELRPEATSRAAGESPPAEAPGYDVLRQRTFAAGTIGTRIQLTPLPPEAQLAEIHQRLRDEPLVEHVETILQHANWVELRVTLRAPMRWEPFSEMLERALGEPIAPGRVAWLRGLLRITLEPRAASDRG